MRFARSLPFRVGLAGLFFVYFFASAQRRCADSVMPFEVCEWSFNLDDPVAVIALLLSIGLLCHAGIDIVRSYIWIQPDKDT